ncbi:response regulator transcription factor [Myroides sp. LJL110]
MSRLCFYLLFLLSGTTYSSDLHSPMDLSGLRDPYFELHYRNSMNFYNGIIQSPQVNNVNKSKTYYLKYQLLKKTGNYNQALQNLDFAFQIGQTSAMLNQATTDYLLEKAFLYIEMQQYSLGQCELEKLDIIYLNPSDVNNQGLYLFLKGFFIVTKQHNLSQGVDFILMGVEDLKQNNASYLIVLYRELMRFYSNDINHHHKVQGIYKLALELGYEKSYAIQILKLHELLGEFYNQKEKHQEGLQLRELFLKDSIYYSFSNQTQGILFKSNKIVGEKQDQQKQTKGNENSKKRVWTGLITVNIVMISLWVWFFRKRLSKRNLAIKKSIQKAKLIAITELTPRQRQIIELVKQGDSNKQIALKLAISINTVKYHLKIIFSKLKIKDRYELRD